MEFATQRWSPESTLEEIVRAPSIHAPSHPLGYSVRIEVCRLTFDAVRLYSQNRVKDMNNACTNADFPTRRC